MICNSKIISFIAAILVLFCGCVPPELKLHYDPESPEAVRIGVLLPLSGIHAARGKMMLNGARFAVEELNSKRGHFGRQVDLIVMDTNSTAEGAAAAFESAVMADVVGIVGGYSSTEAISMVPLASKYRIPLVIPMATADDDFIKNNPFVFRVAFTDRQQSEMIAGFLHYYRKVRRLAIAVAMSPEDIYSRNIARDTAESFRSLGGEISMLGELNSKNSDIVLKNIASTIPDAVLLPFEGKTAASYYKKLRSFGYNGLICGPDSWDDPAFFSTLSGLRNCGNSFYTAFYSIESTLDECVDFRKEFRKKRYYFPSSYEAQTFDAVNMLLIGFGKNASDLKRFEKNWLGIRKHAAATGIYTMMKNGKTDRTIYINKVGKTPESGVGFVPRTITGLQYSRLKVYAVSDDH